MAPKYVTARGPIDASIMVISDAPGNVEEREGVAMAGGNGATFDGLFAAVGVDPSTVRYTNLYKYRPPGNEMRALVDGNGLPGEALFEALAEIKQEIADVRPNLIIPTGQYSLRFLTGKGRWAKTTKPGSTKRAYDYTGLGDYRGSILTGSAITGGTKCVPTYHPLSIIRQYPLKHIVRCDLARVAAQSRFPEVRPLNKDIIIDPQGSDRAAWLRWLQSPEGTESPDGKHTSGAFLTADIEYIGSRLLCLGATRNPDVAVVLKTGGIHEIREIRDLLLSGVPLCFQNGMFDCSILEWYFDIPCIQYLMHDTMVAMHVAYTEFPKDLGFIGSIYTEQPVWWDKIDWKKIKSGEQSIEEIWQYNGIDVWVTHASMLAMLNDELSDRTLMNEYIYEMSLIKPLWEVSKRGVAVNTKHMLELRTTLEDEAKLYLGGLMQINDGKPLNPKSGPQVREFVHDALGLPKIGSRTKSGALKTDDQTMADLLPHCKTKEQIAGIKMIRRVRTNLDLISKFCNIKLDTDNRMRCHYDPAKTDTARLSSRKFYPTGNGANLQNIPKDGRVRAVFVPDPGMFFGYADLKSAESMYVAHKTGDPVMLQLHSAEYMSGKRDGHKYVASFLLEKLIEDITSDERYIGKQCRHALNYMMSWKRLQMRINKEAEQTGVTITAAQAKTYVAKYQQLHPMLKPWWDSVAYQLRTTHSITTGLGRRRTFYGRPDDVLPEAVAFDPQGTIAKALNIGLLRAAADSQLHDLGFQILLQVHDAIGFQAPLGNENHVCRRLVELMRVDIPINRKSTAPYNINIPVDVKIGGNWGEADDENPSGLRTWHDA